VLDSLESGRQLASDLLPRWRARLAAHHALQEESAQASLTPQPQPQPEPEPEPELEPGVFAERLGALLAAAVAQGHLDPPVTEESAAALLRGSGGHVGSALLEIGRLRGRADTQASRTIAAVVTHRAPPVETLPSLLAQAVTESLAVGAAAVPPTDGSGGDRTAPPSSAPAVEPARFVGCGVTPLAASSSNAVEDASAALVRVSFRVLEPRGAEEAEQPGAVSPFVAWIGSPCLRHCVHGASIGRSARRPLGVGSGRAGTAGPGVCAL
jgi:hypothetical protein